MLAHVGPTLGHLDVFVWKARKRVHLALGIGCQVNTFTLVPFGKFWTYLLTRSTVPRRCEKAYLWG